MASAVVLAGGLVLAGCAAGTGSPAGLPSPGASSDRPRTIGSTVPPATGETGIVVNVVDGDTIDVAGVGRIRLIGLDTPERGACGYESATQALAVLVLGHEVQLVRGTADDADRYGRLLRYVDVAGEDSGLALIADGWAIARYDSRDGYGRHPREDAYVSADLAAPDLGCYPDDAP